ncbi:MAG TPA: hypothetical protein VKB88_38245 [Bryobacteraceae bacterium]|nr:hypothetical protein [Bryobacteraceae bacterium]
MSFITAVGVYVVPDQGRDGLLVTRGETVGPVGPSQHLLQYEGIDEDHAVLKQSVGERGMAPV